MPTTSNSCRKSPPCLVPTTEFSGTAKAAAALGQDLAM